MEVDVMQREMFSGFALLTCSTSISDLYVPALNIERAWNARNVTSIYHSECLFRYVDVKNYNLTKIYGCIN